MDVVKGGCNGMKMSFRSDQRMRGGESPHICATQKDWVSKLIA